MFSFSISTSIVLLSFMVETNKLLSKIMVEFHYGFVMQANSLSLTKMYVSLKHICINKNKLTLRNIQNYKILNCFKKKSEFLWMRRIPKSSKI